MEPIVQTLEVAADLNLDAESDLLRVLRLKSKQMHNLLPDVVGMGVGLNDPDLSLTWAATGGVCRHRPHSALARP